MDATTSALKAVGRIYEAALAPDAESAWLDTLCDTVGAEHAMLVRWRRDAYRWYCSHVDQPMRPLVGRLVDATVYNPVLDRVPKMTALRLSEYLPLRALRRTDYYHEVVRPLNGGYAASFTWGPRDTRCAIAICRSGERGRDYGEGELRLLQQVLPHVRGALRVRERIGAADTALADANAALDAVGDGVVILDADGGVRFLNRAAQEILRDRDVLALDRRGLHAVRAHDDARLRALLRDAGRIGRARQAGIDDALPVATNRIALSRAAPGLPLFATVVPAVVLSGVVPSGGGEPDWPPGTTVLLLTDPDRESAVAADAVATAYGLTRREAELAILLGRGLPLAAAAVQLGITSGTARQYLKSVFSKTGMHRQAELVRLLLRGAGAA